MTHYDPITFFMIFSERQKIDPIDSSFFLFVPYILALSILKSVKSTGKWKGYHNTDIPLTSSDKLLIFCLICFPSLLLLLSLSKYTQTHTFFFFFAGKKI